MATALTPINEQLEMVVVDALRQPGRTRCVDHDQVRRSGSTSTPGVYRAIRPGFGHLGLRCSSSSRVRPREPLPRADHEEVFGRDVTRADPGDALDLRQQPLVDHQDRDCAGLVEHPRQGVAAEPGVDPKSVRPA